MKKTALGLFLALTICSCNMKDQADLIIYNGDIYTVDSAFTKCSAVAVKDGIIMATGTDDEILNTWRSARMVDLVS